MDVWSRRWSHCYSLMTPLNLISHNACGSVPRLHFCIACPQQLVYSRPGPLCVPCLLPHSEPSVNKVLPIYSLSLRPPLSLFPPPFSPPISSSSPPPPPSLSLSPPFPSLLPFLPFIQETPISPPFPPPLLPPSLPFLPSLPPSDSPARSFEVLAHFKGKDQPDDLV
jgi:hypothetical protein